MTVAFSITGLSRPARQRSITNDVLAGLPVALAAAAVAWRAGGPIPAAMVAFVVLAVVAAVAVQRARRLDRGWLIRQLDARRTDLEDSADLLFADAPLSQLQSLQRRRLERRIEAAEPVDLRPAWSTRRIATAWFVGLLAVAAILAVPARQPRVALAPSREALPAAPGVPRLTGQRLRIVPPAYTGLPARDEPALDARAPLGSRLEWTLSFVPQPDAADLVFAGGERTPLVRSGDVWTARRILDRSALYRVTPHVPASQPVPPLHRLDAVADAPPQIKVIAPDRSLSLVTPGQTVWALSFEASDDYGVAPIAQLHLTIAEGEGENVKFREQVVTLRGTGSTTVKRFTAQPGLAALKFVAGSDLVAQLVVSDNRAPGPQTVRSPSLILRWPGSSGDAAGMEGVVTRALPAYFTSQRQVIIDAEALLKERKHLTADRFLAKSDGIGADQRLLRLRYGQFLGEEQEGKTAPPPTADAASPPATNAAVPPTADAALPPAASAPTSDAPDADGQANLGKRAFGSEANTLADYGHVHDESEAATLLDPGTRTTLKAALDAMWQSELNLRQGMPQAALPFAYKALGLIKQVQQATRIFLARVGPELPAIDESRRLTGKRDGLEHRALAPAAMTAIDATPATVWRALAEPGGGTAAQLAALENWLRANPGNVADPLAFAAAIDAVRRDPGDASQRGLGNSSSRRALRGLLWSALPRPAAGVVPRDAGDASGRRYLDALRSTAR